MAGRCLVGTSGFDYADWVGAFYPPRMEKKEWLAYYARFFPMTEINVTYYSLPARGAVEAWVRKTKARDFEFGVKAPRAVTHERLPAGKVDDALAVWGRFEENVLGPLREAGRLGAVLVQLSPAIGPGNEETLTTFFSRLRDEGNSDAVVCEFRQRTWFRPRADTERWMRELDIAFCLVDGPAAPDHRPVTASHSYLRMHGRNDDIWFSRKTEEDDRRLNRYDYYYSESELAPWVERARVLLDEGVELRIAFNNHARAKAVRNAHETMELLGIAHDTPPTRNVEQAVLGEFGPR
jgi:uncharacterized protein YecE (DUF72 family)